MSDLEFWNVRNYPIDVLKRFWNKVQLEYLEDGSPNFEKCMIWIAAKDHWGYGSFGYLGKNWSHING